ncbi:lactoylglutathione lyase [Enterococcus sp. PF1-24]|uniref:VOC family protein n=1 Tax=unclassified Enterococcus TaxID=2608891 RepID=UPI00247325A7|nr:MULTISPECIES: VOC family protein [unclassified Enterococcus]MDH6365004.1 lactoylglutathione lyase [Enterococcus sp. PFB1-1]MDH6402105.1 lactoylglutathione lyase [Enterococcus sp. PF1-24]
MFKSMTTNLMVVDVEKSANFYQEILGFSIVDSVPAKTVGLQFAILAKDNLLLMIEEQQVFIEEYPVLQTEKIHPSISLFIEVDGFNDFYQKVKASYPINTELHQTFYGTNEFAIVDPDGYVLTFKEVVEE